ncbi:hypothetical protein [Novosphingobium sp.]|uniref:hypothetical protein n=1 Tax=Novosphingobium sp. TaxID=1874826 RepID=UPI0038BDBB90
MPLPRLVPLLALSTALAGLLGGCGGPTGAAGLSPTIVSVPPPRQAPGLRVTQPLPVPPGLEAVVGADADQLTRLFGPARIDVREADARKLQWSGAACILDAYLYPGSRGARAVATFVDARRGDGRDVDKAACVAALRRPLPGPTTPSPTP